MTDTDGIFDRCYCGGYADVHREFVRCSECAEIVNAANTTDLMTGWNKRMRGFRK